MIAAWSTQPRSLLALAAAIMLVLSPTPLHAQAKTKALRSPRARSTVTTSTSTGYGKPLDGLTPAQLALFNDGLDEFTTEDDEEEGLGPIFNNTSCFACHFGPSSGGASSLLVTRFGDTLYGDFDPLAEVGGSLLQQFAVNPLCQETVPAGANTVIHRQTPPLFGLGLIEAIPDSAILQNAWRVKQFGVKGRAATITDIVSGKQRIGRFGWKAQQATILAFSADAYVNELGITNRFFPTENAPNGNTALLNLYDTKADPEDEQDADTGLADIDRSANYMRLLAPPPAKALSKAARIGQTTFQVIGCAECHVVTMMSGSSDIAALSHKAVNLYSDLLLHDMGSLNDGIAQGDAATTEMKTAPLWGLKVSAPYLHDGRAKTVQKAIQAHDGEAAASRDFFNSLDATQRKQLILFLNSI